MQSAANGTMKGVEIEAIVAEVVRETPDTATLVLSTGSERLDYAAGQFLTIDPHQFRDLEGFVAFFEDLKGRKEPPRAYSMSSAPHEPRIAITVKDEPYVSGRMKYPPLLSPRLLRHTPPGTPLIVNGFAGAYTLNSKILAKTSHLFHICAGSGIVPDFSIIKSALKVHPELHHTLLYSSRTSEDIIFRKQLDALSQNYSDQLKVVYTLTREKNLPPASNVRSGRIGIDLMRECIPPARECHFFVCGPAISVYERAAAREKGVVPEPRFLESIMAALNQLDVSPDRITHESYGS